MKAVLKFGTMATELLLSLTIAASSIAPGDCAEPVISDKVVNRTVTADPNSDPNLRVNFIKDGPLSQELHMPLYEWMPKGQAPVGIVICVHGLTLHGQRYNIIGRAFASEGFYAVATDMRGFGRCYTDKEHKYDVGKDSKQKLNMEKSYEDLVLLLKTLNDKYPDLPIFAMGESLGTSYAIRLSAEYPELSEGIILSGPTVKVNPLMFVHPANMKAAAFALLLQPQFKMTTAPFVEHLVSNDPLVVKEMMEDPLCRKHLTIAELLQTQAFVKKTLRYASLIKPEEPVLVLQGSEDKCMVPTAVTKLAKNIHSSDQTVRWLHAHGHLLLETKYLRPATVDALAIWMREHDPAHDKDEDSIYRDIIKLGAVENPRNAQAKTGKTQ